MIHTRCMGLTNSSVQIFLDLFLMCKTCCESYGNIIFSMYCYKEALKFFVGAFGEDAMVLLLRGLAERGWLVLAKFCACFAIILGP